MYLRYSLYYVIENVCFFSGSVFKYYVYGCWDIISLETIYSLDSLDVLDVVSCLPASQEKVWVETQAWALGADSQSGFAVRKTSHNQTEMLQKMLEESL